MIKAVLFDLDDTLYREYDFVEQAFRHVAEYLVKTGVRQTSDTLTCQMMERMKKEGRGKIFDWLCVQYDLDIPVQELVQIYRETKPVLALYPDGEEILAWLKKERIKTGLITDGNASVQHCKIQALDLDRRMDVVLATYDLGLTKPEPEVYAYCLDKLNCGPKEAVYIGDNPLKDFVGARKLGMHTVRIKRPEGMHMERAAQPGYEADRSVQLLTELKTWIGGV